MLNQGKKNTEDIFSIEDFLSYLQSKETNFLYQKALYLQTFIYEQQTSSFLKSIKELHETQSFLDVGCGSGDFLTTHSRFLNNKTYLGVDNNQELLNIAQEKYSKRSKVEFLCQDYVKNGVVGKFDIVWLRFVLQHISNYEALIKRINQSLSPEGWLIIIDDAGNNNDDVFIPPIPYRKHMYSLLVENGLKAGRNHHAINDFIAIAEKNGYKVKATLYEENKVIDNDLYLKYLLVSGELLSRLATFQIDMKKLAEEAYFWYSSPSCKATLKDVKFVLFQKK